MSPSYNQCIFQKGEAVIWIYYRGNNLEYLDGEEVSILKKLQHEPGAITRNRSK